MRADAALADRAHEVRIAARAWQRVGAIDRETLKAIEARYVDDRARLGPVFRFLAFGFGLVAVNACLGLLGLALEPARTGFGWIAVFWGVVLLGATELLVGPLKRADSGVEVATALMAVGCLSVGCVAIASHDFSRRGSVVLFLAVAALLCALGTARWAFSFLAVGAVVCAFLLLARLPAGRLFWALGAAALTPLLLAGSESSRLPPSERRCCRAALFLTLVAFYIALHVGSWDGHAIEWLGMFRDVGVSPPRSLRALSIFATAIVPVAILGFGIATRRTSLIHPGILLAVASIVTLRFYVHVAPVWVVLAASGAAALGVALALRRLLASGPGKERAGFTAEPLFEDPRRRQAAEMVAVVASLAPGARTIPEDHGRFEPGGGGSGGGGASSDF
jgi:hypothetical protein